MRKKTLGRVAITLASLFAGATILTGVAIAGNSYRFDLTTVSVSGPEGNLSAVLTTPREGTARGLVVMVHGDGPVEATQDGLYFPWFEGAAEAGFATLSWSKPGVGGSHGDWLSQSMEDRAAEVSVALDWAQSQESISTDTIILWGASQAGWVLPKVTRDRDDVDGVVAVGTAINWLRQGRYNLLAELDHDDADVQKREQAISESDRTLELLERGCSYEEYLLSIQPIEPMSEARWSFVRRNFTEDATADLTAAAARGIPLLFMGGLFDRNVDIVETEQTYRDIFGTMLSTVHVGGTHSLARPVMEDNAFVGFLTGTVWPRALLAPNTIDEYRAFLERVTPAT